MCIAKKFIRPHVYTLILPINVFKCGLSKVRSSWYNWEKIQVVLSSHCDFFFFFFSPASYEMFYLCSFTLQWFVTSASWPFRSKKTVVLTGQLNIVTTLVTVCSINGTCQSLTDLMHWFVQFKNRTTHLHQIFVLQVSLTYIWFLNCLKL